MPVAKIDPIETFYSVGSSLVGRILLFFSAGWVGLVVGRVAAAFQDWGDFFRPDRVLGRVFSDIGSELAGVALWPVVVLVEAAEGHFAVCMAMMVLIPVCLIVMVWSEEPAPLWWLILMAGTSIVPVVAEQKWGVKWPSIAMLVIVLAGCAFLGWWLLRKYHPEVIEVVGNAVHGDPDEDRLPPPRRKAPPGAWPEGVKGFEDDGEEDS